MQDRIQEAQALQDLPVAQQDHLPEVHLEDLQEVLKDNSQKLRL